VINVSTVHLIFCLGCVKVLGVTRTERAGFSQAEGTEFAGEMYKGSYLVTLRHEADKNELFFRASF